MPRKILDGLKHTSDSNTVKLSQVIDAWITTNEATWDKVISAIGGPIVINKKKADEMHDHLIKCNILIFISYTYISLYLIFRCLSLSNSTGI